MSSELDEDAGSPLGPDDGEKPAEWQKISESVYLVDNGRTKNGRIDRKMRCDCELEHDSEGKPCVGCGEDCINRLLMIECHPKTCPCGEFCGNQRFQKKQNAPVVIYHTGGAKGWGLRAKSLIEEGVFVREYVGEVCSFAEFQRRTEQYHEQGRRHHYFMTLRGDQVIDATIRGSMSRFMNHSCEPNCETQKWTVNGRLRVGFFTKRVIEENEELTFDYQFERIGEGAQACHCGTPSCTGYIGVKQQKSERVAVTPGGGRHGRKSRTDLGAAAGTEDELTRTVRRCCRDGQGLVREEDVLALSRVMVTADSADHRMLVLESLLATGSDKCLRMFVKLQGLSLLWSWMVDAEDDGVGGQVALRILETLEHLPVMNRNVLKDSKVLSQVTRWSAVQPHVTAVTTAPVADLAAADERPSHAKAPAAVAAKTVGEVTSAAESCVSGDERQPDSAMEVDPVQVPATSTPPSCSDSGVESPSSAVGQSNGINMSAHMDAVKRKADQLLEKWSSLKEVYRIPKKAAKPPGSASSPASSSVQVNHSPRVPRRDAHQNVDKLSSYERERLLCKMKEAQKLAQQRIRPVTLSDGQQRQIVNNVLSLAVASRLSSAGALPLSSPGSGVLGAAPGSAALIPPVLGAAALAAGIPPPPLLSSLFSGSTSSIMQSNLLAQTLAQSQIQIAAAAVSTALMQPSLTSLTSQQQQQQQQPALQQQQQPTLQQQVTVASASSSADWQSPPRAGVLPPSWRSALDSEGKTYYYHVDRRVSQWDFPVGDAGNGDETPPLPTEPASDEECHTPDETPPASDDDATPVNAVLPRATAAVPAAAFSPQTRKRTSASSKPSPSSQHGSGTPRKPSTTYCSIPKVKLTPSEMRQLKESFRSDLSKLIVQVLNPYRKPDCKRGRIESNEDFKHLARKLTFIVVEKELQRKACSQLEYSPSVRDKTQDFVHSYMKRFKDKYIRS